VVYGLSGLGRGLLHAWNVEGVPAGAAVELAAVDCLGDIPCDLAVDPSGTILVAANFGSGTLSIWHLDAEGLPRDAGAVIRLSGRSGSGLPSQIGPHPHQVVFHDGGLSVPDYGADLVRQFAVDPSASGPAALRERTGTPTPTGTAPRHLVLLPAAGSDSTPRVAVSGELGSTMLTGPLDATGSSWAEVPGTGITGPAHSRHERNYPGDIKLGTDGRTVYFANRGYDTVSVFDAGGATPVPIVEIDSGVSWPQHLMVEERWLLVAGWDSSVVVAMPLADGVPGEAQHLFDCRGAGWLLADRRIQQVSDS
jgi:6-phosphogluconolactonase (cycloisomerase 2 family)